MLDENAGLGRASVLNVDRDAFYIASRASIPERSVKWRDFRKRGVRITSSWIDEAGPGETACFGELWERIQTEIILADHLVLYAEPDDFPLKGALIEVGMALALGKRVTVCLPGVQLDGRTHRPIGSWIEHRSVTRCDDIEEVLGLSVRARIPGSGNSPMEQGGERA